MPPFAGPQPQPMPNSEYPFQGLIKHWLTKIDLAYQAKQREFGDDAAEAVKFFDGPYDFLYGIKQGKTSSGFIHGGGENGLPKVSFGMTCNKVAEMVQLFGPVLYHRNPIRQVNPRQEPMIAAEVFGNLADPQVQMQYQGIMQQVSQGRAVDKARAQLLQYYLNYTPTALNLKDNSRWAIDEAIIKGMGTLWTEKYVPPGGGPTMIGSFYESVDNLIIDCDGESLDRAKWIARRCVHPVWEVEQMYGIEPGTLKGHIPGNTDMAYSSADYAGSYKRAKGNSNDLMVYWKIFSKMGMGQKLAGVKLDDSPFLETFGDFVYLVIADTSDFILNLPPSMVQAQDTQGMLKAAQWPTPYWADDAWPVTPIQFHTRPRCVWPMSHLKPGLGELKFINWVYSFMASKLKTSSRDLIAVKKSLNEEIKNAILHGADYELIEIEEQHGTITEAVQFLKHPPFSGDIFKVLQAVEEQFERRVGLNELMYGGSPHAMRSASEAQLKSEQLHIRPDDMANKVEDSMTTIARKEALGARWHLQPQDLQPVLGQVGAYYWQQLVYAANPSELLHQLEYRIESGSAKKPNKDRDAQNMQNAMTSLFPFLSGHAAATGDVGPLNALITDWAKSIDLDASKYILQPPAPPPQPGPAAGPQNGPAPGPQGPGNRPSPAPAK